MNTPDSELGIPQEGYPAPENRIAADPDNETSIYRTFDSIATRYLFYQQAQLLTLKAESDQLQRDMCQSSDVSYEDGRLLSNALGI